MHRTIAYFLKQYPCFTQTFIVREVEEMRRQGVSVPVFSLQAADPDPGGHFSKSATDDVIYAPKREALVAEIKRRRADGELTKTINGRLATWGKGPDKMRLYEAIWAGEELRKKGIQHIHVHFAGVAARTAYLIKEFYGITYSWTGHAQDIFCETDHPVGLAELLQEATTVITVADFSAIILQKKYPAAARKIHRVYNGISIPATIPLHSETNTPLVLSVGRLIKKKGFSDLILACAGLRDRKVAFSCQIVGEGPLQTDLEALIAENALEEKVILVGSKSQDEIRHLLERCRVFALAAILLPDGDSDNLPTVITEAMTYGIPVVSTRVAGIPEQVSEGVTGLLVEPGDVDGLGQALETLLVDNNLAKQFGKAGYDRARQLFAIDKTVIRLRAILVERPWWKFW